MEVSPLSLSPSLSSQLYLSSSSFLILFSHDLSLPDVHVSQFREYRSGIHDFLTPAEGWGVMKRQDDVDDITDRVR
jgi:hypothetical protein